MIETIMPTQKPSQLTTGFIFIGRSLLHSLRNLDALLMAILLPVLLMLMFTYVFGGAIAPGGGYVNYVVPGIILLCAGFGSSSTAMDVTTDMTNGIIERFRTMPISSTHVITGHVIASLVRNLMATGIVIGVALLVGFRPDAGPVAWVAAIGIIAFFILTITWLFAAIGLVAKTPAAASGYGFILLFLPYLSSAFVPVDTMPEWLRGVAGHQPITPITETIRALMTGSPPREHLWWALGWCASILAVAIVWSAWSFRRKAGRR